MKKVRHQVRRIHHDPVAAFDQQFWPVLMAICVVAAIAAGAIVSLLHGTAMWISLLLLPVVALTSIIILYRMEDSFLRRSLQFAILLSLGIHLLILMISSLLTIFSAMAPEQTAKLIRKPERRIVVSNKTRKLVIERDRKQLTPDKPIETQKTQTNPETQPREVPIVKQERPEDRQISQRRMEKPVVPRKDQQLSQKRRNDRNQLQSRPLSSTGQVAIRSTSQPAASPSVPQPSPKESELKKQISSSAKTEKSATSDPATAAPARSGLQRRASARNSSTPAESSKATARSRRENVSIPRVANRATVMPEKRVATPSPTARSTKLNINRQSVAQTAASKSTSTVKNVQPKQLEQISARRMASTNRNPIKSEPTKAPERTVANKKPTTKANLQPPKRSISSATTSRTQPQPRSFAITRSSQGAAGAGRSSNLERVSGGDPSPVQIASDSSQRQQTNRVSDNISLSSLQQSNRTDSGRNSDSQRVLKANTVRWAQQSGSQQTSVKSVQASAAAVDSSLSRRQGEVAMEKGASMLDVGPTKVVTETTAQRRSGGGSPNLSDSLVQKSELTGGRTTNNELKSDAAVEVESSQVASSSPAQPSTSDSDVADFDSRTSPESINQTTSRGQLTSLDVGAEDVGTPMAMSQLRDANSAPSSSSVTSDDPARSNEDRAGNTRSRATQAPSVNQVVQVGGQDPAQANSLGQVALKHDGGVGNSLQRQDAGSGHQGTSNSKIDAAEPAESAQAQGSTRLQRRGNGNQQSAKTNDGLAESTRERGSSTTLSNNAKVELVGQSQGELNVIQGRLEVGESSPAELSRQSQPNSAAEIGMRLEIDAEDGAAGLADVASRRAGTPFDASFESDQLSPQRDSRFMQRQSGGAPSVTPNVAVAKDAFRKRTPAALSDSGPSTEAAIEMGLAFLARNQLADGSWTLGQFDTKNPLFQSQLNSDTAATGLALLAFQGAGYNHREYKYAAQVKAGIDWLIRNQDDDGGLYVEGDPRSNSSCRMYSHAIAALALTEAYGMTQDESIREATQRALNYIADTQDRAKGGWRYYATRNKRSSDTSVTGWMMMALKSAKLAGLNADKTALDGIDRWLGVAQSPDLPHQFRYNPYAVDSPGVSRAHGREISTTMTSVGLLMKVYSGWNPDDAQFLSGVEALLTQLPSDQNSRVRDTYYWYYATQVLKHAGGDYWERWRGALHPLLISSQVKDGDLSGSWHPYEPVPDRWGPQGGRLYVTTMNLLSLEVKYRFLPLYEKTID